MYAEILIQHAFARKQTALTYGVPAELNVKIGDGVLVPFQRGEKAGLVLRLHAHKPEFATKNILGLLNEEGLLQNWQIELAEWIAEYYFCSKYDAFRLMLPKNIFRKQIKERKSKPEVQKIKEEVIHTLTPEQGKIVKTILEEKPKVSLIRGITGSGKTEIYKHLIKNFIQKGEQCLLLVPEISLTPQLLHYFEAAFPEVTVIHSRISEGKRAKVWREIQSGKIHLVLGSRSALFSPFKKLGLIIMDEEHEWSYKQDQSPRYHARETALKCAELTGAQVVFGSATPSIETYFKAQNGEFALFELEERIAGTPLPTVQIIDMREELKARNFSIFSEVLEQKIRSTLEQKEQIILFLNRRGTSSSVLCRDCGFVLECPNCDLPLTHHARKFKKETLLCHHCGQMESFPELCPKCKGSRIKTIGVGTEKVETELRKLFPLARIQRADRDTMGKKDSFSDLHDRLHNREIDILIGTQMIGKGLDVPNVSLVGVILADLGLHIPDFRTSERIFQLLTQVAGRAGRREKQGEVLIQTYNPDHPSIFYSQTHDYKGFYEQEISARKESTMPPFGKILKLMISNKDQSFCENAAKKLEGELKAKAESLPLQIQIYAAPALLPRIKGQYQWNVLLQGQNPAALLKDLPEESLTNWRIDADPQISV
ncbi:MAG: primosomal protein N' [Candidatus Gracilibacteria bacterium]|jgi:primosomal protein N' (replication factor Y)